MYINKSHPSVFFLFRHFLGRMVSFSLVVVADLPSATPYFCQLLMPGEGTKNTIYTSWREQKTPRCTAGPRAWRVGGHVNRQNSGLAMDRSPNRTQTKMESSGTPPFGSPLRSEGPSRSTDRIIGYIEYRDDAHKPAGTLRYRIWYTWYIPGTYYIYKAGLYAAMLYIHNMIHESGWYISTGKTFKATRTYNRTNRPAAPRERVMIENDTLVSYTRYIA